MSSDKPSNQGQSIVPSKQSTTEHMPEHEIEHTVQIQDGDGSRKKMTVSTIIKFRPPSWMLHPQVQTTVAADAAHNPTTESASASSSVQVETRITMPFNAVATPVLSPEIEQSQSSSQSSSSSSTSQCESSSSQSPSPLPTPAPESSPEIEQSQSSSQCSSASGAQSESSSCSSPVPTPQPTPAPESSPFLSQSQTQASQPQSQVAEEQEMGSQELRVITRIQTGPWTRQMTKQYGRGSKYEPFTFCNIPN